MDIVMGKLIVFNDVTEDSEIEQPVPLEVCEIYKNGYVELSFNVPGKRGKDAKFYLSVPVADVIAKALSGQGANDGP